MWLKLKKRASWLKQDLTLFVTSTVIRSSKSENSYFPTEDRESLKSILKWTGGDLNPLRIGDIASQTFSP
jgi:hypothetical protein